MHCCSNIFLLNIKLALCYFEVIDHNSNSNWTFIALNLPIQEDSKVQLNLKAVDRISVSRHKFLASAILVQFTEPAYCNALIPVM